MRYLLCLKCGEEPRNKTICQNCGNVLRSDEKLLKYAFEAYYFGYIYREKYEEQLMKSGVIKTKYNLIEPNTIWQLLIAFALAGVVGNIVYDTLKNIGNKLIKIIRREGKEIEYKEFINIISDDLQLRKIFNYIKSYYNGMPDLNRRLKDLIFEEKLVSFMVSNITELETIINNNKHQSQEKFTKTIEKSLFELIKERKKGNDFVEMPTKAELREILINSKQEGK